MSLGLKRGVVKLSEYNPDWGKFFLSEKVELEKVLGKSVLGIEHVGSTAIPGIKAKPILDLMVAVHSLDNWSEYTGLFQKLGYEFRRDMRDPQEHILFVKGPEENRTHYLKLTTLDSNFWKEHIVFRDFIIGHQEYAREYERLKETLLDEHACEREPYTAGKAGFIEKMLRLAGYQGKIV